MKTIAIIGCGWLGLPLGNFLSQKGYKIKGSTTTASKLSILYKNGIEAYLIKVVKQVAGTNIRDFFTADLLIINIPPDRKRKDVVKSYPKRIKAIIERGLTNGIKKVIFISATSIYGNNNRLVTEADDPEPEKESGKALLLTEDMLLKQDVFDVTILRVAGLVGPGREAGRFLAGKKSLPNGKALVNLVHQEDVIHIIAKIIALEKWGEFYNVCADEHPQKAVFYRGKSKEIGEIPPSFKRIDDPEYKIVSNYKVKKDLNYTFIHPDPMLF